MLCSALQLEESYSINLKAISVTKLPYHLWLCYLHFTVLRSIQMNGNPIFLFISLLFAPSEQPLISQLSTPQKIRFGDLCFKQYVGKSAAPPSHCASSQLVKINLYENVTKNVKIVHVQYFVTFC